MLVLVALLALTGFAQTVEVSAPWLTAYDQEGLPRWEINLARLSRAGKGWEGEEAEITLFSQGEPAISVRAPRFSADQTGQTWALLGGLAGEGEGFAFQAEEAHWAAGLVLTGFQAEGNDLVLQAREARWELGGPLELWEAKVEMGDWTLSFPYGQYLPDSASLTAQSPEAWGQGLRLSAELLQAWPKSSRLQLIRAHVVRSS